MLLSVRAATMPPMRTSESPTVTESLTQEYAQMLIRLERGRERAQRLRDLADQAAEQVTSDEQLLRSLAEVLGVSPQATIDSLGGALRGQRLREVAVEVLKRHRAPGETVHYRDWFGLLQEENIAVAGRDPLATFLAQISRSADVEAIGRRTGQYRLVAAA
jgi:hypothetical protein